jgi:transcription initiation factor TFIIE subunit alpha
MDLSKTLIRTVARAFYETRHILVVDALFLHSVLHAEDLAFLMGMQQKDLRKLCAKLREDRLIGVYVTRPWCDLQHRVETQS